MRTRNEHDADPRNVKGGVDRRLTVTYYVEPQHLRTVSIPVRRANALLASLAVAVVWAVGTAGYFSYALYAMVSGDPAAVPASASVQGALETGAAVPANDPQPVMPEVALPEVAAAPVPETTMTEPTPAVEAQPAPAPVMPTAMTPRDPTQGKVIEPKLARAGRHLNVRFAIVNEGKGAASGRVWGVAEYRGEDGELRRIASHPGVDAGAPEDAANYASGLLYKARIRANKSLAFALPPDVAGKVEAVSIVTSEKDGNAVSVTRVAVQP